METDTIKVAVATLNAKAYYKLTSLLKEMNLPFDSVSPTENIDLSVQLILTTKRERKLLGVRPMLCLEDLVGTSCIAREKIFSMLYSGGKDILVIGIDPGKNTGIVAHYREKNMIEKVTRSLRETLSLISDLVKKSQAEVKVIRIGDGDPKIARTIATNLIRILGREIEVEIVNERGTSIIADTNHAKESKDLRSARIISFRKGKRYQ